MTPSLLIGAMYEEAALYEKRANDDRLDDKTRDKAAYKAQQLKALADRMYRTTKARGG